MMISNKTNEPGAGVSMIGPAQTTHFGIYRQHGFSLSGH